MIFAFLSPVFMHLFSRLRLRIFLPKSLCYKMLSSLPADQSESCEGLLTVDECFRALSGMARWKSLRLDGLPAEFYLKFWGVLGFDQLLLSFRFLVPLSASGCHFAVLQER